MYIGNIIFLQMEPMNARVIRVRTEQLAKIKTNVSSVCALMDTKAKPAAVRTFFCSPPPVLPNKTHFVGSGGSGLGRKQHVTDQLCGGRRVGGFENIFFKFSQKHNIKEIFLYYDTWVTAILDPLKTSSWLLINFLL